MADALRARALALLARREMSRFELRRKLEPLAQSAAELDLLLDSLTHSNLQSDKRFTDSLVHRRAARFGASRIAAELDNKGVAPELTADAVRVLRADEEARALDVWRRKFASPARSAAERAKQGRFLMSRGFSADVVHRVVGGKAGADEDGE